MMLTRKAVSTRAVAFNRRASLVVRANAPEQPTSTPAAPAAPVSEEAINAVTVQQPIAVPVAAAAAPAAPSLFDCFKFDNAVQGPEIFNGRLAMLGLFAAVGAELATGESALTQFESATPIVLATWALMTVASLVPLLRGADPTAAFGPFTRAAELANGRAAMIGVAGLLIVELTKGSALF